MAYTTLASAGELPPPMPQAMGWTRAEVGTTAIHEVAMRFPSVLIVVFLTGCATFSPAVSSGPSPRYATLSFSRVRDLPFYEFDGLWYVDKYRFKTHREVIYVAEGERTIGYQCQGKLSADDWPSLRFQFERGKTYDLVCEIKEGQLHVGIQRRESRT